MDFTNLKMTFDILKKVPRTTYQFGEKGNKLEIIKIDDIYSICYKGKDIKGFYFLTVELPDLLTIQIKQLYNGFGIDKHEIESCIKTIQAWKNRKDRNSYQSKKNPYV